MSSKQHRNLEAAPAGIETLESLRHMTASARPGAHAPDAALEPMSRPGTSRPGTSRPSTAGFLVDGLAASAMAFYPGFHAHDLPHESGAAPFEPKPSGPSLAGSAAVAIGGAVTRLWRRYRHHREVVRATAALAEMDDRALRDIGLTRMDVGRAARHGRDWDRWR